MDPWAAHDLAPAMLAASGGAALGWLAAGGLAITWGWLGMRWLRDRGVAVSWPLVGPRGGLRVGLPGGGMRAPVAISLNDVRHDRLAIRTVAQFEQRLAWRGEEAALIRRAASRTTEEQPFLRGRTAAESGRMLRAVVNSVSCVSGAGHLASAMSMPSVRVVFLVGLTLERYGPAAGWRLRAQLARPEALEELFRQDSRGRTLAEEIPVENTAHADRLRTLRVMHAMWMSGEGLREQVMETVELALPILPEEPDLLTQLFLAGSSTMDRDAESAERSGPSRPARLESTAPDVGAADAAMRT